MFELDVQAFILNYRVLTLLTLWTLWNTHVKKPSFKTYNYPMKLLRQYSPSRQEQLKQAIPSVHAPKRNRQLLKTKIILS